jgi:hypothetical protein
MTTYVLWRTGPRRPYASLLCDRSDARLTDHEALTAIGTPIEVRPEHEGLAYLDQLIPLYPCPGSASRHMATHAKLIALSLDQSITPEERELAKTRAAEALVRAKEAE